LETALLYYPHQESSLKIASRTYSEPDLVNALRNKNQNAFSYLYDNYAPNLNVIILKIINNRQLSEDLLQEVFVKIWNNFDSYDQAKGRLFTWMCALARNLAIDLIRAADYRTQSKTTFNGYATVRSNADDELKKFDFIKVDKHICKLNAEQYRIIDLAYFRGMTQKEISVYTGIPLGTVKTKMRTAILQLRKRLA
jgi:RNA polymerase sigma-70 factor (ECF subfamily)